MKRIFIVTFILCAFGSAFAQNDLIDRVTKQALEIDSLKKVIKVESDSKRQLSKENYNMHDTLIKLKSELGSLEEFRIGKKKNDSILRQKTDSIVLLKDAISEKEKHILVEKQNVEQKEREKYETGKNEILAVITNSYKNQSFDESLKTSTKSSVQRDVILVDNQEDVKQILSDIEKYFNATEVLYTKVDPVQIKNVENILGQVKRESASLVKLKEVIGNYQIINDGLKETTGKIFALDNAEAVSGMSKDIQKKKFDKILAFISAFLFKYDFNFSDYPYLSDIMLELIKRKQPNPDADISDLLKRL